MFVDPSADETEEHATTDNGDREADEAEAQSFEIRHGRSPSVRIRPCQR